MAVTQSHIATVSDPASLERAFMQQSAPEHMFARPVVASEAAPQEEVIDTTELYQLLMVITSQIQECLMLVDDAPPGERGALFDQISMLLAAGGDLRQAISKPTQTSVSKAVMSASRTLINIVHDQIDDLPEEAGQAEVKEAMLKSYDEAQKLADAKQLQFQGNVDHVEDLPEAMRDYFEGGVVKMQNVMQSEEVQASFAALMEHSSAPNQDVQTQMLLLAFQALSEEQQRVIADQLGVALEALNVADLGQALNHYEAEGFLQHDILCDAYHQCFEREREEEELEALHSQVAILAFEALHLNLVMGQQMLVQQQMAASTAQQAPAKPTEPPLAILAPRETNAGLEYDGMVSEQSIEQFVNQS